FLKRCEKPNARSATKIVSSSQERILWPARCDLSDCAAGVVAYPNTRAIKENSQRVESYYDCMLSRAGARPELPHNAIRGVVSHPNVNTIGSELLWVFPNSHSG